MSRAFPIVSLMMVLGAVSGLQAQNLPPSNPQNRLRPIPEDRMTPALGQALAEYRKVRPDGDATYMKALSTFGEEGVVQTAVTIGLYSYLSLAVNMAYPESASRGRLEHRFHNSVDRDLRVRAAVSGSPGLLALNEVMA